MGGKERGRERREGLPSPSCSSVFRKDAIISPQEGGTEWIIRQCGGSGWGLRHPQGHFLLLILELGQTLLSATGH